MAEDEKVKKIKKGSKKKVRKAESDSGDDDDKHSKAMRGGAASSYKRLGLALVALVALVYLLVGRSSSATTEIHIQAGASGSAASEEASAKPPAEEGKKKRKRQKPKAGGEGDDDDDDDGGDDELKLSDVDVIESKFGASLGWHKLQGPLVVKRPPRECSVKRIAPQVTTPFFIVNKKNQWKRRIYTCLRFNKQACSKRIMDDFEARRWKIKATKRPLEDRVLSTFVLTDSTTLSKLSESKPAVFEQLWTENEGSTYLNALLGASGLDGSLMEQFQARAQFTQQFGCAYNALKVQPPQFRFDVKGECSKMERQFSKHLTDSWLLAAFDEEGREASLAVKPTAALDSGSFCSENAIHTSARSSHKLASLVLGTPFKLQSKLFDVRGYILIGSTMPMMVFFQQGYVRQADGSTLSSPHMFDEGSADIDLEAFQEHLAKEKITGSHYVDTFLKSSMKQVALFVFHAARTGIRRRRGSFQLFSVDYVIDRTFRVYLEKTSGAPDLDALRRFDPSAMVADMHDLVQELHEVPVAFEGMVKGDKYGKWELIFSELSETCHKIVYNPCHEFIDFNDKDLIKSNRKVGKVQATAKRLENEQKRIVKKTEEKKKATCRENKVPYPGAKCNKLLESMDQEHFNQLFKEHEESFNPNEFRLPKPGEVFPHEIV